VTLQITDTTNSNNFGIYNVTGVVDYTNHWGLLLAGGPITSSGTLVDGRTYSLSYNYNGKSGSSGTSGSSGSSGTSGSSGSSGTRGTSGSSGSSGTSGSSGSSGTSGSSGSSGTRGTSGSSGSSGTSGTSAVATGSLNAIIDGFGSTITTGIKGDFEFPFAATINSWTLVADQTGSIVIDVWKDTYANFPPLVGDSIAGTEKPTLSAVNKNQDLSLTTWTTSITSGDIIRLNVDSATTVTRVTLSIKYTKV